jgi:hypothetical protein
LGCAAGKSIRQVIKILFDLWGKFSECFCISSRRLYGGYSFLKYGTVGRALQDLTGAVVQSVPPSLPLLSGSVPRSTILVAISDTVSLFYDLLISSSKSFMDFRKKERDEDDLDCWQSIRTQLLVWHVFVQIQARRVLRKAREARKTRI